MQRSKGLKLGKAMKNDRESLTEKGKLFSRGNSLTQQWEHFFTSSGKIALAVGTLLHYQWQNNSRSGNSAMGMIFTNTVRIFTAVGSLFFWQWELSSLAVGTSSGSGNSITGSGNALEEFGIEVCEEQKQKMEDTMLELVEIYRQKELLCMHDNEVKNVVEQPAERGNRIEKSLQNFRVIHKSSISLKNTSQFSPVHAVAPILSTKEPEYSPSMGYEHPNTTLEMDSDEIIKSGVEELVPILSENEVTLEDKRECDMPVCEDLSTSDDVEYVEASLPDPEIVSEEEENDVNQEEEEVDLKDISQIQDIDLREKLLSITRLIANIESFNDNPTPDRLLNSSVSIPISKESDNSLSDNFSPEYHTEETRSGITTTHADESLPEYDSFCFEIEPGQERLINILKSDISNDSSSGPLLEEADLFLASDNLIPPGIENFADDSEGDVYFLEELLIDDSILSHESFESNFEDNRQFHDLLRNHQMLILSLILKKRFQCDKQKR
nr:hypothetical protein [Tanacetum cinerariifolium]